MNLLNNKNLILLFENFYSIDILRFDLISLSKKNKVTIYSKNFYINLDYLKKKQINFIEFKNYLDLKFTLSKLSINSIVFFFINKNQENSFFFNKIEKFKFLKISMHHTSQIPYHKKNIFLSLVNFKTIKIKYYLIKCLNYVKKKKITSYKKFYDYVVTAGNYPKRNFSYMGKKQIDTISRDFQTYKIVKLRNNTFSNKNYILYCDDAFGYHPDEKLLPNKTDYNEIYIKNFYEELYDFFLKLEKHFKLKVIIAAHPKRKIFDDKIFLNREYFSNQTCELTINAKCLIGTISTSMIYGVLTKKPIIIISSKNIKDQSYRNGIIKWAKELKTSVINISNNNMKIEELVKFLKIKNNSAYNRIFNDYICNFKDDVNSIWDKILQELNNRNVKKN